MREDSERVIAAVPVTGYGVEVPWMYAKIHPQEAMWGGEGVSRVVMAQGKADIPRRGGCLEDRGARISHEEDFLPGGRRGEGGSPAFMRRGRWALMVRGDSR